VKKRAGESAPYKAIARYLRAIEPLIADESGDQELADALHKLSRYLAKTSHREIEAAISSAHSKPDSGAVAESILKLSLQELEQAITRGYLPRRQLEMIANLRFGVPTGSMRSYPRVEHLVSKLLNLIENEKTHNVIDAAAKRSAD